MILSKPAVQAQLVELQLVELKNSRAEPVAGRNSGRM
jgi:hypothetical protein